jgi:hypothetical protein
MGLINDTNLDFLSEPEETAPQLLKEIKDKAQHLVNLYRVMTEAEEAYEAAKKAYEMYAYITLPNEMKLNGISLIQTTGGDAVRINTKYYCSPNKNETDRAEIREWLRGRGGDSLIKERLIVPQSAFEQLKASGIPFDEDSEVNTNSLKAWIKGELGASGRGIATLSIEDIPKCIHFMERDEAEVVIL